MILQFGSYFVDPLMSYVISSSHDVNASLFTNSCQTKLLTFVNKDYIPTTQGKNIILKRSL